MRKSDRKEQEYALIHAVAKGDRTLAGITLRFGARIDSTVTGSSALHVAVSMNRAELARWLLEECKASPDVQDKNGQTPLHYACREKSEALVRLLEEGRKASLDVQDKEGQTALHFACAQKDEALALMLIENGASLLLKDKAGRIPLARVPGGKGMEFMDALANRIARRENEKTPASPLPSPKPVS